MLELKVLRKRKNQVVETTYQIRKIKYEANTYRFTTTNEEIMTFFEKDLIYFNTTLILLINREE